MPSDLRSKLSAGDLSRALVALGYPTAREVGEYLRWRDQRFAKIDAVKLRQAMNLAELPGLQSFDTGLHFARFRFYFCYPPPVRKQAAIETYPRELKRALKEAAHRNSTRTRLKDLDIIKDDESDVRYIVHDNRLVGVLDRNRFRLPVVRNRSRNPRSPWGDGWSETSYVSYSLFGESGDYLQVWVA